MFPEPVTEFFAAQQELLWLLTLGIDLCCTVILFRLFGKAGLQVAIAVAIILANLQGPKLTEIFGLQTSLGVIFITGDRWLWLRNNLSTMSSQALDTVIYSLVAWWGVVDLATALALGAAKYLLKIAIAAIDTVFIYWARRLYRRSRAPVSA